MADMSDDMPCCPDKSAPVDCDQCPLMALCVSTTCRRRYQPALPKSNRLRFESCFPAAIPKWKASRTHPLQNLPDPWSVRRNAEIRARRFCGADPMLRSQLTRRSRVITMKANQFSRSLRLALTGAVLDVRRHRRVRRREELRVQIGRTDRQGRSRQNHRREARRQDDGKPVPDAVIFGTRLDMAPDGMQEMATRVTPLPGSEPGTYRFKATFGMAGRWQLSLARQGAG
jgi:hypothetical protein